MALRKRTTSPDGSSGNSGWLGNLVATVTIIAGIVTIAYFAVRMSYLGNSNRELEKENTRLQDDLKSSKKINANLEAEVKRLKLELDSLNTLAAKRTKKMKAPDTGVRKSSSDSSGRTPESAEKRLGILTIELPSNIFSATIFVDDFSYGEQRTISLHYGKHKIRIVSDEGIVEREVTIPDKNFLPISTYDFQKGKK